MSLDIKGQKCAICTSYLFPEDDTVYCPTCGAPHHRDCYNTVGHCGMEELHGTEGQYKPPVTKETPEKGEKPPVYTEETAEHKCPSCGQKMSAQDRFCPRCGTPANGQLPFQGFSPFQRTVEIKDDTRLDENLTALEAAKIVRVNPFRYVPKFLALTKERKTSWNWAAFLMPGVWFAYRKMYLQSFVSTALMIMTLVFNVPFNLAIMQLPTPESSVQTALQMGEYYAQYLGEIGMLPLVLALVGMVLSIVIRIFCGIFGDWMYKNRVIEVAERLRSSENPEEDERRLTGTSFLGFAIAFFAVEFIPSLISMFIL